VYIRSDICWGSTAAGVCKRLDRLGVGTLFIESRSPWEEGYIEWFDGKFRPESPNCGLLDTCLEAQLLLERWGDEFKTLRPRRSAIGPRHPRRLSRTLRWG
jgi:hypothetical protein